MIVHVPLTHNGVCLHPRLILVRRGVEGAAKQATLFHEHAHADRMRRDGWLVFLARWLLSARWRTEYEAEGHARGEVTLYATLLPIEIDGETVISGDGLVMFYARRLACTHRLRLAFGPVPDVLQRSQMLLGYLDGSRKMPRGRPCAWLLPWAALVGCVFALAGAWTAAVLAGLLLTLEGLTD